MRKREKMDKESATVPCTALEECRTFRGGLTTRFTWGDWSRVFSWHRNKHEASCSARTTGRLREGRSVLPWPPVVAGRWSTGTRTRTRTRTLKWASASSIDFRRLVSPCARASRVLVSWRAPDCHQLPWMEFAWFPAGCVTSTSANHRQGLFPCFSRRL